jgi:hypothetical protein
LLRYSVLLRRARKDTILEQGGFLSKVSYLFLTPSCIF